MQTLYCRQACCICQTERSASAAAGFSPKLLRERRQGQEIKTEAISLSTSLSGKVLHPLTSFYDMPQTA